MPRDEAGTIILGGTIPWVVSALLCERYEVVNGRAIVENPVDGINIDVDGPVESNARFGINLTLSLVLTFFAEDLEGEFPVTIAIRDPRRSIDNLGGGMKVEFSPEKPSAFLVIQITFEEVAMGRHTIDVFVGGLMTTRVPFTVRVRQAPLAQPEQIPTSESADNERTQGL